MDYLSDYRVLSPLASTDFSIFNQNNLDKADTLFGEGKYLEALPYYENLIKINPNHINSLSMKGAILINLREYEKAIQCYDSIISIKPFGVNAYYIKNK